MEKTGFWIERDEVVAGQYHEISECSKCGFTTDKLSRDVMKFCPNCGVYCLIKENLYGN